MTAIIAAILLIPLVAYFLSRRLAIEAEPKRTTALRCAALFAVGLTAAAPFATSRAVGTGEAYNYSLAVADAVTQIRSGVLPPLVGQTEFAFNGRIHPLRNAPYLFYLIAGFDFLTLHHLSFWELQNFSLVFSLVAAVFAAYGGLRWGTECRRPAAFFLAAAYGLSPSLLAAAFTVNMFMTVHAAVFVPLALGACLRQCRHPGSRSADALMAAALAAAWLAHPPVAFWLTASVALVRGLIFLRYPTWHGFAGLAGAAVLGVVLAAFVFASAGTISTDEGFFAELNGFGNSLMPSLRSAFPACLLPVSRAASELSDFQLGYVCWGLLALLLAGLALPGALRKKPRTYWAVLGSAAAAIFLLILTLPVPGLTIGLWNHSPAAARALTNVWPMQRFYLVATALVLFAAALVLPRRAPRGRKARFVAASAVALAVGWTVWEARPFIARGFGIRWSDDDTARSDIPSNLDLTVTAYSFLGTPPTFVHGVTDPQFEFRLLRNGQQEIDSSYAAALKSAPVIARGAIRVADRPPPQFETEPQKITLQPGRRYLLTFAFRTPPLPGRLYLRGPAFSRWYILPAAGGPEGFGMDAGNRRSLSVWTSEDQPEEIEIRFKMDDWAGRPAVPKEFAEFTLQEVDPGYLPIRLDALLPLRFTVTAPEPNCYVDTPRRWLPGYLATVNGRPIVPLRSPLWDVMMPVPQGRSVVELRYVGSSILRPAFWLSAAGWLGFAAWFGGRVLRQRRKPRPTRPRRTAWMARHPGIALAAAAAIAAAAGGILWTTNRAGRLDAAGPIRVTLYLPFHQSGHRQPLVVTGRSGAGTDVFLEYLDESHLRVGADIWGSVHLSPPIPTDYFLQQNLVVDSSALYPLDHPRVQALTLAERERLRGDFRVEWNGRVVLEAPLSAYDSLASEVAIGDNRIGASSVDPQFSGEILRVKRLPFSSRRILAGSERLRIQARFPAGHIGITEPVLSLGPVGDDGICGVTYLPGGRIRLTRFSPEGKPLASAEETFAPGQNHALEFALGAPSPGASLPAVSWWFDGDKALGPAEPSVLDHPEPVLAGLAPAAAPGIDARFTGSMLEIENPAPNPIPPLDGQGPMRLIVILPRGKTGRQEPLVTSGRTGQGDFIYVVYFDESHIRLGYDHWGVSGGLSDPIAVDYARPHEFVIALGSLYPPGADDDAWGGVAPETRRRLQSEMTDRLDGRPAFGAHFTAHPSAPGEITAGLNRIGGSSCDAAFTGVLYSAERLGLANPPAP